MAHINLALVAEGQRVRCNRPGKFYKLEGKVKKYDKGWAWVQFDELEKPVCICCDQCDVLDDKLSKRGKLEPNTAALLEDPEHDNNFDLNQARWADRNGQSNFKRGDNFLDPRKQEIAEWGMADVKKWMYEALPKVYHQSFRSICKNGITLLNLSDEYLVQKGFALKKARHIIMNAKRVLLGKTEKQGEEEDDEAREKFAGVYFPRHDVKGAWKQMEDRHKTRLADAEKNKKLTPATCPWKSCKSGGNVYYFHEKTRETRWSMPRLFAKAHDILDKYDGDTDSESDSDDDDEMVMQDAPDKRIADEERAGIPSFIKTQEVLRRKPGYKFQFGKRGLGWYRDLKQPLPNDLLQLYETFMSVVRKSEEENDSPRAESEDKLMDGTLVEVQSQKGYWYPGHVIKVNSNGTYDISAKDTTGNYRPYKNKRFPQEIKRRMARPRVVRDKTKVEELEEMKDVEKPKLMDGPEIYAKLLSHSDELGEDAPQKFDYYRDGMWEMTSLREKLQALGTRVDAKRKLSQEEADRRAVVEEAAKEALAWRAAKAPSGHVYYYNSHTKKTQWTMPPAYAQKFGIDINTIQTLERRKTEEKHPEGKNTAEGQTPGMMAPPPMEPAA